MDKLVIAGTEDTPEIQFDPILNEYFISGRYLPEDVASFYKPVFDWLNSFASAVPENSKFQFKLEYFNTASSKILLDILMRLEEIKNDSNVAIKVIWHYHNEDEDMKEAGEEYSELVEMDFELLSY